MSTPPKMQFDPEQLDVARYNRKFGKLVKLGIRMGDELKQFILYAFLAQTDLHPSECTLVQAREGDKTYWWYARRDEIENHNQVVIKQREAMARQKQAIDSLVQQVEYLKRQVKLTPEIETEIRRLEDLF